jgi:hypothetical protein
MPLISLAQAYRIAPRVHGAARVPLPQPGPQAAQRGARARPDDERGSDGRFDDDDCDTVRRSPLLRALLRSLQLSDAALGAHDGVLERALIVFARALNLATGDVDAAAQPAAGRAGDAAQRRVRNEQQLLVAFAELQHAAGRAGAVSHEALQARLAAFLHALARELHVDDDRAGEATQPGSLISVRA